MSRLACLQTVSGSTVGDGVGDWPKQTRIEAAVINVTIKVCFFIMWGLSIVLDFRPHSREVVHNAVGFEPAALTMQA